jgi:hypothetical protein
MRCVLGPRAEALGYGPYGLPWYSAKERHIRSLLRGRPACCRAGATW